jgi:hypothetical protein
MKHISAILIALSILTLSLEGFAQDTVKQKTKSDEIQTLFKKGKHANGGYGSLWGGYTQVDGKDGFCYGLSGAWLIGHTLGVGIAATGFLNDYVLGHNLGSQYQSLQGAYGGLFIEPIIFGKFPVHVSFPCTFGIGGVAQLDARYWDHYDYEYTYRDSDLFFVAEPGIDLELNMLKHLRLGIGARYRFTSSTQLTDYSKDALNGFSLNLGIKFGKF